MIHLSKLPNTLTVLGNLRAREVIVGKVVSDPV